MMQDEIMWIMTVINLCLGILNNLMTLLKKEKMISKI
jgi:hypothetical protein